MCGSSSSPATRARARASAMSKSSTRKNKRRPLGTMMNFGMMNAESFVSHLSALVFPLGLTLLDWVLPDNATYTKSQHGCLCQRVPIHRDSLTRGYPVPPLRGWLSSEIQRCPSAATRSALQLKERGYLRSTLSRRQLQDSCFQSTSTARINFN
jgi:hypothetical protein